MVPPKTFSTEELLACARRELALRKRAYPKWVEKGNMDPGEAQRETEAMQQIVNHFRDLAEPGLF